MKDGDSFSFSFQMSLEEIELRRFSRSVETGEGDEFHGSLKRLLPNDLEGDLAGSGAVEFEGEDALPATELKFLVHNVEHLRGRKKEGFAVRVAVLAFAVAHIILTVRMSKLSWSYSIFSGATRSSIFFMSPMRRGSASFTIIAMVVWRLWIFTMPFAMPDFLMAERISSVISMNSSVAFVARSMMWFVIFIGIRVGANDPPAGGRPYEGINT